MRHLIITLLFWLIGERRPVLFTLGTLFGAPSHDHQVRKKRWEKSLARVWSDKDLLDFLYYQAEADKENIFRGAIRADLARGARARTLFIVYQAQMAHLRFTRGRGKTAEEASGFSEAAKRLSSTYKTIAEVK